MAEKEMGDAVLAVREGRVMRLVLNRPDDRNTIVPGMIERIAQRVEEAMVDAGVGAILVEGAGRDFCAGGSLSSLAASGAATADLAERTRRALDATRLPLLLSDGPKPTVAALRGAVAGGGLAIAAACDVRIAARGARISFAYSRIGLSGDMGATLFLSRLLGPRMRAFALLSPVIGGDEAQAIGLVDRVTDDESLAEDAGGLALQLAGLSPQAVAGLKRNIAAARDLEAPAALAVEAENFARCQLDPNHREAALAFVGKRQPVFRYDVAPVTAAWPGDRSAHEAE